MGRDVRLLDVGAGVGGVCGARTCSWSWAAEGGPWPCGGGPESSGQLGADALVSLQPDLEGSGGGRGLGGLAQERVSGKFGT